MSDEKPISMWDAIKAGAYRPNASIDRAHSQQDRDYTHSHECPEEWPRSGLMTALDNLRVPLTREEQDAKNARLNALFASFDEQFAKDAEEMKAKYPTLTRTA